MDIKTMGVNDLKALKSDIYEEIARLQNNLQIINNEIKSREKKPVEKPAEKVEKLDEKKDK